MAGNGRAGLAFAAVLIAGAMVTRGPAVHAHQGEHPARQETPAQMAHPSTIWNISRGGQLYDNWMDVLEKEPPPGTHPAYPATGKQKGAATWRCKECHGWDYRGRDGAYASGPHYTGIEGVRGAAGKDPQAIAAIITDPTHRYTKEMIPRSALDKLALFLSRGQIDMDRYIDRATRKARGSPARGARYFQTICAVCHGFEGKEINFHSDEEPEYVGTVCAENPWEALHKIRFGQPGVGMVAMTAIDVTDQVDILAYCQTLPTK